MSDDMTPGDKVRLWNEVALVYGYNELAKQAPTLAEKIYFRIARGLAEEEAEKLGTKINSGPQGNVVMEIGQAAPFIILHERDIEGMRAAVAKWDVEHPTP